jgi:S1-C subfamily serine protease
MRSRQSRAAGLAPTLRLAAVLALTLLAARPGLAQAPGPAPALDELVAAVVGVKTFINPDARTSDNLGHERQGSGVVIDAGGLVLTIGYLMVEAHAAELVMQDGRTVPASVVGYDHETGFGLLRAAAPLKVRPMALGRSAALRQSDRVVFAASGGAIAPVHIASLRPFAGSWEYLLERAIFTMPPVPNWSGAALISRDGKLVGICSLVVGDARASGSATPGNMFVPIELLPPILADLIADGRAAGPSPPWLGVAAEEKLGDLVVQRVTAGGAAVRAGVRRGDRIVGVAGARPQNLADFYRKLRAVGAAGVTVPLDVTQDGQTRRIDVKSINRLDHLKLKSTL